MKAKEKKTVSKIVRESKGAGSRRIFSPVFKLQVLDSYRQDADCQGNQRATARKYGIHRRQIQKWLQMETNLRLSVQQSNVTALNLSPARQSDASVTASDAKSCLPSAPEEDSNAGKEVCNSDSDEYVNVDEITDSEDDETSSCSSHDKALDFTCATLSKRRFYPSEFKLHVVDAFKNDKTCQGNQRATARKFGIHRRQVQKWLNKEQLIKCEHTTLNNSCLDLSSYKRKLDEESEFESSKRCKTADDAQESALCLVKNKMEPLENNNSYHHIVYPSPVEHSFNNNSYLGHEYPLYVYQPWNYCYQPISAVRTSPGAYDCLPKYSYSFNFKYETCLLYTSPSPRDRTRSRMPSSA